MATKPKQIKQIIIDPMNSQLLYYYSTGANPVVRTRKISGDKKLVETAIKAGMRNKVKVYDRFTRKTLAFDKIMP